MEVIDGWKTYILAAATVAYALGGMYLGHLDPNEAIPLILGALGLGALRHGVAKGEL
jgi:hypothetical protein